MKKEYIMTSNIDKDLTALVKLAKVQEKALAVTMKKINSLKKKIDVVVPEVKPVESVFMKIKINWYDDKI
jgi:Tfp pilus assembly protein PilE